MGQGTSAREVIVPAEKKQASQRRISDGVYFVSARCAPSEAETVKPLAPIRVTSPGLTVYKGGAITPRVYLIRQHLGPLKVNRQVVDLSLSYTPSPRVQLEAEVPVSRTSFHDASTSSG